MDIDACHALLPHDEPRARTALDALYARSDAAGDAATAWQAAAGMLIAISLEFTDFRDASLWCGRFLAGLPDAASAPLGDGAPPVTGLRLCAACLVVPSLSPALATDAPQVTRAAEQLDAGLAANQLLDADERLVLSKLLADHLGLRMDLPALLRVADRQQDRMRRDPPTPLNQARWWLMMLAVHEYWGQADAAQVARQRVQSLLDAKPMPTVRFALAVHDMPAWLKTGQLGRAERLHREIEALLPDVPQGHLPQGLRAQASFLAQRGDWAAALERIDRLLGHCRELQVPERDCGAYHVLRANVLVALGMHDEALACLQAQRPHQQAEQGELLAVIEDFCKVASLETVGGSPEALLRQAFGGAARLRFQRFLACTPALAGRLCLRALDAGVEPEFVRAVVRERHLPCPDPARADWPWRLRIRLLGALRVERDDLPLTWAGKLPRKPLELLCTLAAASGAAADQASLIDALWPSVDADAPRASLEMAVTRLRRLLDLPEAVVVGEGSVALDAQLAWSDVRSFELLSQRLLDGLDEADDDAGDALARLAGQVFALWTGPLLGLEAVNAPLRQARERLASRWLECVLAWGGWLEQQARWREAQAHYEQALGQQGLAEPMYRALMRVQLALGERAEALRTYRRCADLLRTVLGTAPGEPTEALHHQARDGATDADHQGSPAADWKL